jgi:tetratricopeptide (TPR) repeat protein
MTAVPAAAAVLSFVALVTCAGELRADAARAAALRARAFEHAYNLDYPAAVELFNQALAESPNDSATHRARAAAAWLHIIFRRGSITVDQYLGGASRSDVKLEKPPPEEAEIYRRHAARALELADQRLRANPRDVSALYDVGAAVGLQASYIATVEGRIGGAFGAARRAFNSHERVLELDPSRTDAGLIVGTYRYVIASLALPVRWVAYVAGFGGDKEKGLELIEQAARHRSDAQVDAKFALMLLYNREKRFADALAVIRELMARFPRNRVLRLEAGATAIRGQRYSEADRLLTAGIDGLASDARPRAFGEEAMWYYKRGLARLSLRRLDQARADLDRALQQPMRDWVRGRIRLEQGKLADLEGRRADARAAYSDAIRLATAGNDPEIRHEAERLQRTPFK